MLFLVKYTVLVFPGALNAVQHQVAKMLLNNF